METLADRIARQGQVNELDAVGWAIRLCKRLEALHALGVAHGSVSPACILASGVERAAHGVMADLTRTPSMPSFQSPERVQGGEVSAADDTWAAAATLYKLLTSRDPFEGASAAEVKQKILAASPSPLAVYDVGDDDLQHIVDGAFVRDFAQRTTSITALRRALEEWHPDPRAAELPPLGDEGEDPEERTMMRSLPAYSTAPTHAGPRVPSISGVVQAPAMPVVHDEDDDDDDMRTVMREAPPVVAPIAAPRPSAPGPMAGRPAAPRPAAPAPAAGRPAAPRPAAPIPVAGSSAAVLSSVQPIPSSGVRHATPAPIPSAAVDDDDDDDDVRTMMRSGTNEAGPGSMPSHSIDLDDDVRTMHVNPAQAAAIEDDSGAARTIAFVGVDELIKSDLKAPASAPMGQAPAPSAPTFGATNGAAWPPHPGVAPFGQQPAPRPAAPVAPFMPTSQVAPLAQHAPAPQHAPLAPAPHAPLGEPAASNRGTIIAAVIALLVAAAITFAILHFRPAG